jgi:glycosyltransferase involved in cell wall biosynthesis
MSEAEPDAKPRRIFVDATSWLGHRGRVSGIPRVIEEVVRRSQGKAPEGTPLSALVFSRGRWLELGGGSWSSSRILRHSMERFEALKEEAEQASVAGDRLRALRLGFVRRCHRLLMSICKRFRRGQPSPPLGPGDVILSLDMQSACLPGLSEAVARGAKVVSVLYDCLPLTHPEFFPYPPMRESYAEWHGWAYRHSSGVIAISETSMREAIRLRPEAKCWHAWFHLGADLPAPAATIRPELSRLMDRPVFLMVGTVEPRKNHALALAAMEQAWSLGCCAALVIIGGKGWSNRDLLARIADLRAAGRPIMVIHDVGDAELAGVYERARALIAASVAEGYGLPLAEAAARGLAVLASDIPVFREIAPRGTTFFPLDDEGVLAQMIVRTAQEPLRRHPERPIVSWDAAVRKLLKLVEDSGRSG